MGRGRKGSPSSVSSPALADLHGIVRHVTAAVGLAASHHLVRTAGKPLSPKDVLWISSHQDLLGDPRLGPEQQQRFLPSRFDLDGNALDARGFSCRNLACPRLATWTLPRLPSGDRTPRSCRFWERQPVAKSFFLSRPYLGAAASAARALRPRLHRRRPLGQPSAERLRGSPLPQSSADGVYLPGRLDSQDRTAGRSLRHRFLRHSDGHLSRHDHFAFS